MINNHDIIYPKTFLPHPFRMCMTFLTMPMHGISIYRSCVGDLIVSGHPIEHSPRIFHVPAFGIIQPRLLPTQAH